MDDKIRSFLHNLEVFGMSAKRAADLAGVKDPYTLLKDPEIIRAREEFKQAAQAKAKITKNDIIEMYMEAVQLARTIADPMAMIRGTAEISKMLGFDAPTKLDLRLTGTVQEAQRALLEKSDAELLAIAQEDSNILDAEFYEVGRAN